MGTGVSMTMLVGQRKSPIVVPARSSTIPPLTITAEAYKRSREIDKELKRYEMKDMRSVRLLLLGAGESGKSTFAKQMRIIHKGSYSNLERANYMYIIYSNVLTAMANLLHAMKKLQLSFYNEQRHEDANLFYAQSKLVIDDKLSFTPELADAISRLWKDPGLRKCFMRSNEFQIIDSAAYFFKAIHRIAEDNYMPTDDDIVRSRLVTTGVLETTFQFRKMDFTLIDVGGQRTERRKWIHFFENVTAILFCVALSEYDQRIREDDVTNRMQESLNLFGDICTWKWFHGTPKILFLNKYDIFRNKLRRVPISVFFKDYQGTSEINESRDYIYRQFASRNKCTRSPVYHHYTTATERNNVEFVFDAAMDVVLKNTLTDVGMIM